MSFFNFADSALAVQMSMEKAIHSVLTMLDAQNVALNMEAYPLLGAAQKEFLRLKEIESKKEAEEVQSEVSDDSWVQEEMNESTMTAVEPEEKRPDSVITAIEPEEERSPSVMTAVEPEQDEAMDDYNSSDDSDYEMEEDEEESESSEEETDSESETESEEEQEPEKNEFSESRRYPMEKSGAEITIPVTTQKASVSLTIPTASVSKTTQEAPVKSDTDRWVEELSNMKNLGTADQSSMLERMMAEMKKAWF